MIHRDYRSEKFYKIIKTEIIRDLSKQRNIYSHKKTPPEGDMHPQTRTK